VISRCSVSGRSVVVLKEDDSGCARLLRRRSAPRVSRRVSPRGLAHKASQRAGQVRLISIPSAGDRRENRYAVIQQLRRLQRAFDLPDRAACQPCSPHDAPFNRSDGQLVHLTLCGSLHERVKHEQALVLQPLDEHIRIGVVGELPG
jgi:hypothetical protein